MKNVCNFRFAAAVMALCLVSLCGCKTSYQWTNKTPEDMRTVSVPVFRNESDVTELGAVATRQILREFQREGTFKIRDVGDSAIEIQGVVKNVGSGIGRGSRASGQRLSSYEMSVTAIVSVVDKKRGKVLINNKKYTAETLIMANGDILTAKRDAGGRIADLLAQKIVDDVVAMQW